jgi:hypothetical protein
MPASCSPDKIVAALHEQTEIITDIVREEIKDSPNLALRMVPDGGTVRRNANNSSVIYGEAKQASVAYNSVSHAAQPLEAVGYSTTGDFKARTSHGNNGIFNNLANEIEDNACHGQFTIDFAQGYRNPAGFNGLNHRRGQIVHIDRTHHRESHQRRAGEHPLRQEAHHDGRQFTHA